jgi:preprotein translocase subunit SecF
MADSKILPFMAWRRQALFLSVLLSLVAIGALAVKGLALGLDFTGGSQVELHFAQPVSPGVVRAQLADAGFSGPVVAHFGSENDLLIRVREGGEDLAERVLAGIRSADGLSEPEVRRVDFVGPQIGDELRDQGGLALLVALGAVLLYVSIRFQYKLALGAVAALAHDVLLTIGFFAVFGLEVDLAVLAAVLTVIGYSINDTIVVFDRVRENFRLVRKGSSQEIMDLSMTQTLERSLLTSGTTLLVVAVLFWFGGEAIHNFAIALLVGIGFGTYSSIYIASALALELGISREDLLPPAKEGPEFDGLP